METTITSSSLNITRDTNLIGRLELNTRKSVSSPNVVVRLTISSNLETCSYESSSTILVNYLNLNWLITRVRVRTWRNLE